MALPRQSYLDPRPRAEALGRPIADAVNIPLAELPARLHELPPPNEVVRIAASPHLAQATGEWLAQGGRGWSVADYRFAESEVPGRLWEPHPFVAELAAKARPGRALDLGCGTGRDAIYLASAGWQVTAVDRLADAVARGQASAERLGIRGSIDWIGSDAETFVSPNEADLILMIFFLDRLSLTRNLEVLRSEGAVIMEVYTPTHRSQTGKPRDSELVMDEAEARRLFTGFDLRECVEGNHGGRHTLRVWAQRQ